MISGNIKKRMALMFFAAGTMLLMASATALAVETINCLPGLTCDGTERVDLMRGSTVADTMHGLGARDNMRGNLGSDTMYGGLGNDTMTGLYGKETMDGEDGRDTLRGNYGADNLTGGPGNDTIDGGPGNDTIDARDGELDSISCGTGTDEVTVDQEDLDAETSTIEDFVRLTSCETINEPEDEQTTPPIESTSPTAS